MKTKNGDDVNTTPLENVENRKRSNAQKSVERKVDVIVEIARRMRMGSPEGALLLHDTITHTLRSCGGIIGQREWQELTEDLCFPKCEPRVKLSSTSLHLTTLLKIPLSSLWTHLPTLADSLASSISDVFAKRKVDTMCSTSAYGDEQPLVHYGYTNSVEISSELQMLNPFVRILEYVCWYACRIRGPKVNPGHRASAHLTPQQCLYRFGQHYSECTQPSRSVGNALVIMDSMAFSWPVGLRSEPWGPEPQLTSKCMFETWRDMPERWKGWRRVMHSLLDTAPTFRGQRERAERFLMASASNDNGSMEDAFRWVLSAFAGAKDPKSAPKPLLQACFVWGEQHPSNIHSPLAFQKIRPWAARALVPAEEATHWEVLACPYYVKNFDHDDEQHRARQEQTLTKSQARSSGAASKPEDEARRDKAGAPSIIKPGHGLRAGAKGHLRKTLLDRRGKKKALVDAAAKAVADVLRVLNATAGYPEAAEVAMDSWINPKNYQSLVKNFPCLTGVAMSARTKFESPPIDLCRIIAEEIVSSATAADPQSIEQMAPKFGMSEELNAEKIAAALESRGLMDEGTNLRSFARDLPSGSVAICYPSNNAFHQGSVGDSHKPSRNETLTILDGRASADVAWPKMFPGIDKHASVVGAYSIGFWVVLSPLAAEILGAASAVVEWKEAENSADVSDVIGSYQNQRRQALVAKCYKAMGVLRKHRGSDPSNGGISTKEFLASLEKLGESVDSHHEAYADVENPAEGPTGSPRGDPPPGPAEGPSALSSEANSELNQQASLAKSGALEKTHADETDATSLALPFCTSPLSILLVGMDTIHPLWTRDGFMLDHVLRASVPLGGGGTKTVHRELMALAVRGVRRED